MNNLSLQPHYVLIKLIKHIPRIGGDFLEPHFLLWFLNAFTLMGWNPKTRLLFKCRWSGCRVSIYRVLLVKTGALLIWFNSNLAILTVRRQRLAVNMTQTLSGWFSSMSIIRPSAGLYLKRHVQHDVTSWYIDQTSHSNRRTFNMYSTNCVVQLQIVFLAKLLLFFVVHLQ